MVINPQRLLGILPHAPGLAGLGDLALQQGDLGLGDLALHQGVLGGDISSIDMGWLATYAEIPTISYIQCNLDI